MISIIYSNNDFMVVEKPAGIPTLRGKISPSFAEILEKENSSQKQIPDSGITHRLDNDVSGLLLVAKNITSFKKIRELFSGKKITKEYTILVHGFIKDAGTIKTSLTNKKSSKKTSISTSGDISVTKFENSGHYLLKTNGNLAPCSLVKAVSTSGKRHQIRVHFLNIGHPVVSDLIYDKKNKNILPRIFFHASGITLNWNEKIITIKSKLPSNLEEIKKSLIKRV